MKQMIKILNKLKQNLLKKYPESKLSFSEVIDKAEMLLELERKQLTDAYNEGHIDRQKGMHNENKYDNLY